MAPLETPLSVRHIRLWLTGLVDEAFTDLFHPVQATERLKALT
jgi:hypothetical protein